MSKITELCTKFNVMWDAVPEPKRFIYFACSALVWSVLFTTVPILGTMVAATALYIRLQRYEP